MMKILATIGPCSDDFNDIKFIGSKTCLFRLNGSHNTLDWHRETVKKIRTAVPNAFILMDIPGIKPRTANARPLKVSKGQLVSFGKDTSLVDCMHVDLTKDLPTLRSEILAFTINDGQFVFDEAETIGSTIFGRSRQDFILAPRKGLNIPNSVYSELLQRQIYIEFIDKVSDLDINGVGLSFVQTGDLVSYVRKLKPNLVLVSKIENSEGFKNREEIICNSDAVMIDRGDLAAEIGMLGLYRSVEKISKATKAFGRPLIMATENLETMITRLEPSKSEVMSLGHSSAIGSDCIMLSEETATSANFKNTMTWLHRFLEEEPTGSAVLQRDQRLREYPPLWQVVQELPAGSIALFTRSGRALFELMSSSSVHDVTIVTNNKKVSEITKLYKRSINIIQTDLEDTVPSEMVFKILTLHKDKIFVQNDELIAIYVSKQFSGARVDNMTFIKRDVIDKFESSGDIFKDN